MVRFSFNRHQILFIFIRRVFLDKRLSEEVPADTLGDEFKGYVFKITGGYDKEGFSMMQGVMSNHRTRYLDSKTRHSFKFIYRLDYFLMDVLDNTLQNVMVAENENQ
jgi:hypothetical protein